MLKEIKNVIGHISYFLGQYSAGTVILTYHSIGNNQALTTVSKENFEKQISFLIKEGWNFISSNALVDRLKDGLEVPHRSVVITFDDGYSDVYENALPILKKYKIPATFFVSTKYIGGVMKNSQGIELEVMKWDQLKEISVTDGMTIASHTHSHLILDKVTNEKVCEEFRKSKVIIEEKLNDSCGLIAYPKGKYNQNTLDLVSKYYVAAFATTREAICSKTSVYEIPRRGLYIDTTMGLFKRLLVV